MTAAGRTAFRAAFVATLWSIGRRGVEVIIVSGLVKGKICLSLAHAVVKLQEKLFDFDFDLMTPADVAPSPAGACGLQLSSEGIRW